MVAKHRLPGAARHFLATDSKQGKDFGLIGTGQKGQRLLDFDAAPDAVGDLLARGEKRVNQGMMHVVGSRDIQRTGNLCNLLVEILNRKIECRRQPRTVVRRGHDVVTKYADDLAHHRMRFRQHAGGGLRLIQQFAEETHVGMSEKAEGGFYRAQARVLAKRFKSSSNFLRDAGLSISLQSKATTCSVAVAVRTVRSTRALANGPIS